MQVIIILLGVFCCSTAVIMIKASAEQAVLLSALRLLLAGIFLTPLFWRGYRDHRERYTVKELRASLLPGVMLALHFISWIVAARLTTATNASLIVNLAPIVMPFLMHFIIRERVTTRELTPTALALTGLLILTSADFH